MLVPKCTCGYHPTSEDDLTDHLSHALVPADDTAEDGQLHAEAAAQPPWTCLCGHHADTMEALDTHLLTALASTRDTDGGHTAMTDAEAANAPEGRTWSRDELYDR